MYLGYDEYVEYGGQLSKADFSRLAYRAEKIIDLYTHDRLKGKPPLIEVRRCIFELIDYMHNSLVNGALKGITSISNDGYSISYEAQKTAESEIKGIIYEYLAGTDAMYMGTSDVIVPDADPDVGYEWLQVIADDNADYEYLQVQSEV